MSRAVLVTGGASGIGRATVELFLADGWSVLAADLNETTGAALLADLHGAVEEGRLRFARTDVAEEGDVVAALDDVVATWGRLDCVVNNAGVGGAFGPLTEVEVEDWDYTFDVLVRGVFLGMKHGVRRMTALGTAGAFVNVASVAGLLGDAGPQAYSVAKAAVIHLGRVFAAELAPQGIRVNTVCPGAVQTPLNPTPPELFATAQPLPVVGRPEHLADAIHFLAGDRAAFITGECIGVDGGLVAAGPRIGTELGLNSRSLGKAGVNRGTTGQGATVRRAVSPQRRIERLA